MRRIRIIPSAFSRYFLFRWILFCFIHLVSFNINFAQSSEQIWVEYMLNFPFANSYNIELAGTYSANVESPKWRALDLQITPEWSITQHVDVMGAFLISQTYQSESVTTFEHREMLGARFHFTPNKRILTRMLVRVEQRNVDNLETNEWTKSNRARFRLEAVIPINKPTMYSGDKLWYAIADVEAFLVNSDVEERFANRLRTRIGPGYRINYNFRVEFVYTWQLSRDTLEEDFETSANIFRFRIKHYLRKGKPAQPQGAGN